MFDKFFDQHKPEHEELPSENSAEKIRSVLCDKLRGGDIDVNAQHTEVRSMKKKHIIRGALISAAAAITAAVSLITVNADYESDEKYIVRVNNIRVEYELSTYEGEDMTYDVITFELPCEIFVDENGGPINPEAENEFRKVIFYTGEKTALVELPDGTLTEGIVEGRSGWRDEESAERRIPGLPYGGSGSSWSEEGKPSIIEIHYDTDFVKQYWENYQKENPDVSVP